MSTHPTVTRARALSSLRRLADQRAEARERWEIYTVLADSETFYGEDEDGPACCGGDGSQTAEPAASAASCC